MYVAWQREIESLIGQFQQGVACRRIVFSIKHSANPKASSPEETRGQLLGPFFRAGWGRSSRLRIEGVDFEAGACTADGAKKKRPLSWARVTRFQRSCVAVQEEPVPSTVVRLAATMGRRDER